MKPTYALRIINKYSSITLRWFNVYYLSMWILARFGLVVGLSNCTPNNQLELIRWSNFQAFFNIVQLNFRKWFHIFAVLNYNLNTYYCFQERHPLMEEFSIFKDTDTSRDSPSVLDISLFSVSSQAPTTSTPKKSLTLTGLKEGNVTTWYETLQIVNWAIVIYNPLLRRRLLLQNFAMASCSTLYYSVAFKVPIMVFNFNDQI